MLSKKALEIIKAVFSENSNVNLPAGLAEQILEIRKWVEEENIE